MLCCICCAEIIQIKGRCGELQSSVIIQFALVGLVEQISGETIESKTGNWPQKYSRFLRCCVAMQLWRPFAQSCVHHILVFLDSRRIQKVPCFWFCGTWDSNPKVCKECCLAGEVNVILQLCNGSQRRQEGGFAEGMTVSVVVTDLNICRRLYWIVLMNLMVQNAPMRDHQVG